MIGPEVYLQFIFIHAVDLFFVSKWGYVWLVIFVRDYVKVLVNFLEYCSE